MVEVVETMITADSLRLTTFVGQHIEKARRWT